MPELGPVLVELSGTAGVSTAPLVVRVTTVRVGLTGTRCGKTDLCQLLILVTHCVAVLLLLVVVLVVLVVRRTRRGEAAGLLLHPVDTFVQITHKLVPQLGAVRVVYTGNLLQISVN